jgi:hypothetical protein
MRLKHLIKNENWRTFTMKTIFTLLLGSILTTSAFAADEGRLTITVSTQKNVHVVIDNRTYRLDDDDNSLILNNVRPGQHTIQVYRNRGNNRNNSNSRYNRNNRNDILYSSTVYVRPNYDVDIMINRFGKALVDERDLRYSNDDWGNNGNYGNGGYGNGGYGNGNNNGYNQAMNENDFNQLLQKIRNQWVGKITVARDGINKNYLTTYQVRQILQVFSSESDKLELAKLAYRNTVDQRNYTQLYDVFSFQSSRDELDQYIRNNRW